MMSVIWAFLAAIQFLTILPVRLRRAFTDLEARWSTAYFPVVGLLLGIGLYRLDTWLADFLPVRLSGLVTVLAWVLLTGAMHLEGWADFCDGMFVKGDRERALACMRDPRVGAYGAIGVVLLVLLKLELLVSLDRDMLPAALIFACAFARYAAVLLLFFLPPARQEGLAKTYAGEVPLFALIAASAFLFTFMFTAGRVLLHVLLPVFLAAVLFGAWVMRRLGGITGDACGAAIELLEVVALAQLYLVSRFTHF